MAERLTFEGNFCDIAKCRKQRWGKYCPDGACSQRKVWERLKEYEDAADVAPVRHGRWIEDHDYLKCPDCSVMVKRDFTFFDIGDWNYCPNCGARMDGAE